MIYLSYRRANAFLQRAARDQCETFPPFRFTGPSSRRRDRFICYILPRAILGQRERTSLPSCTKKGSLQGGEEGVGSSAEELPKTTPFLLGPRQPNFVVTSFSEKLPRPRGINLSGVKTYPHTGGINSHPRRAAPRRGRPFSASGADGSRLRGAG